MPIPSNYDQQNTFLPLIASVASAASTTLFTAASYFLLSVYSTNNSTQEVYSSTDNEWADFESLEALQQLHKPENQLFCGLDDEQDSVLNNGIQSFSNTTNSSSIPDRSNSNIIIPISIAIPVALWLTYTKLYGKRIINTTRLDHKEITNETHKETNQADKNHDSTTEDHRNTPPIQTDNTEVVNGESTIVTRHNNPRSDSVDEPHPNTTNNEPERETFNINGSSPSSVSLIADSLRAAERETYHNTSQELETHHHVSQAEEQETHHHASQAEESEEDHETSSINSRNSKTPHDDCCKSQNHQSFSSPDLFASRNQEHSLTKENASDDLNRQPKPSSPPSAAPKIDHNGVTCSAFSSSSISCVLQ